MISSREGIIILGCLSWQYLVFVHMLGLILKPHTQRDIGQLYEHFTLLVLIFFFFKLLRTTSPLSTGSLPDGGGVDGGGNGGTAAAADDGSKTQVSSSTE